MSDIDSFHGAWLHFRKGKSQSVFSAVVCKIQASKRYVESFPLVLKDTCVKETASNKVKGSLYSCLLPCTLALRK